MVNAWIEVSVIVVSSCIYYFYIFALSSISVENVIVVTHYSCRYNRIVVAMLLVYPLSLFNLLLLGPSIKPKWWDWKVEYYYLIGCKKIISGRGDLSNSKLEWILLFRSFYKFKIWIIVPFCIHFIGLLIYSRLYYLSNYSRVLNYDCDIKSSCYIIYDLSQSLLMQVWD